MSLTWERPPTEAWPELMQVYVAAIRRGVRGIAERYSVEIEGFMKQNASWEDRSGNARQTLRTSVGDVANEMVDLILSHGVNYGIYLELANQGQYAIIGPSLDLFAPRIWQDVVFLISRESWLYLEA